MLQTAVAALLVIAARCAATTYTWSPTLLATARGLVALGYAPLLPAYTELLREADALACGPTPAPVTAKNFTPPTGTRHTYVSAGRYDWPCTWQPTPPQVCAPAPPGPPCNASTGLPWAERDGCPNNAAVAAQDGPRWEALSTYVRTLGLAYYFSQNESYAALGTGAARAWFLGADTAMLPNLAYAQYVPGKPNTYSTGMIDFSYLLPELLDALALLSASPSWTAVDAAGMQQWAADLLHWQLSSTQGREERNMPNNHGTWHDAQALALALFTGNASAARAVAVEAAALRLDAQIAPNGSLPQELLRADALSYERFDIEALQALAQLAGAAGVDLWGHATPAGATLASTLTFLVPYALQGVPWPFSQAAPFDWSTLWTLFRRAALATSNATFANWGGALPGNFSGPTEADNLIWCWACA